MVDLQRYATADWRSQVPVAQEAIELAERNPSALAAGQLFGTFESAELVVGRSWLSWSELAGAAPAGAQALESFGAFVQELDATPLGATAWNTAAGLAVSCTGDVSSCPAEIFKGTVKLAAQTFGKVVSSYPVLGWIASAIGLGVNVGRLIWAEARGGEGEPEVAPLQVDALADQRRGEVVMGLTRAADWTPIFLPEHDPSVGGWLQHRDVRFPSTGEVGGRIWMGTQTGPVAPLGQGLVPGQADVAVEWQYRGKQASTGWSALDRVLRALKIPIAEGKNPSRWTTYDLGYFRPSLPQLSSLLWAEVMTKGPAMFRVNADALATAWDAYFRLWLAAASQMLSDNRKEAVQVVMNVLSTRMGFNPFGWPHYGPKLVQEVDERYRDLLPISYQPTGREVMLPGGKVIEEVVPVMGEGFGWWTTKRGWTLAYIDNLRARQRSMLDTLEVAYLTGDEPALSGDLRAVWDQNRRKLLEHPALRQVDFERVPPSSWRTEAVNRKLSMLAGAPIEFATQPPVEALVPAFAWGQGAFTPGKVKPMQFAAPDGALQESGGGGVGGALIAGGLAAAVVAFIAARRR